MNFLFFAWFASIAYAFAVIISKLLAKYNFRNPWLFNFIWSLSYAVFTLIIALIARFEVPHHWLNLLLASFFYALSGILYILSLFRLDVSVLSPLFNVRSVVSVFLGVAFLSEVLSFNQLLLIIVIILASIFVTVDEKWSVRSFFSPSVFLALLCMISLSFTGFFVKKAIADNGYWTVTALMPVIAQLLLLVTWPKFSRDLGQIGSKSWLVIILITFIDVLGGLAANKAYEVNVSISSVILSLPFSMMMAFILALIYPQLLEKHPLKIYAVRFLGAAFMVAAAVSLSLT